MRKIKKFKIEPYDKQFEVRELTVREILEFVNEDSLKDLSIPKLREIFEGALLAKSTNIEYKELLDMAPSEIETIWNNFKEVNSPFLSTLKKAGLETLLETIRSAMIEDFLKLLANSSSQATQVSLTTGTPSS